MGRDVVDCVRMLKVNYAGQTCECVGVRHKFICVVLMNKISGLAMDYVHMYIRRYVGRVLIRLLPTPNYVHKNVGRVTGPQTWNPKEIETNPSE